jgi:hypothetical protein
VCIAVNALVCLLGLIFCLNTFFLHHECCNKYEGLTEVVDTGTTRSPLLFDPGSQDFPIPTSDELYRTTLLGRIEITTTEIDPP